MEGFTSALLSVVSEENKMSAACMCLCASYSLAVLLKWYNDRLTAFDPGQPG